MKCGECRREIAAGTQQQKMVTVTSTGTYTGVHGRTAPGKLEGVYHQRCWLTKRKRAAGKINPHVTAYSVHESSPNADDLALAVERSHAVHEENAEDPGQPDDRPVTDWRAHETIDIDEV